MIDEKICDITKDNHLAKEMKELGNEKQNNK